MAKVVISVVLRVLMVLIFALWIAIWLVKPMKVWSSIWHGAEDRARTTIVGDYGLNFAVYTFPIIALAIVGYVYLDKKPGQLNGREPRVSITALSSPLVVSSTLGILSFLEILVVILFILFLAWTVSVRISNDFRKMTPAKSSQISIWQLKYWKVAIRFGSLAEACIVLMLLPVLRGMAIFRVLGIQFEASIQYHIWLATAMLIFSTFHGLSTYFVWGIQHRLQTELWRWQRTGRVYLAGEVALLAGLVIYITSLPAIRRKRFEVFYYTHHLYMVFFLFFLFHAGDRHFYTVLGGIFLFGIDKVHRIIQSRPQTCMHSARILPGKVVELTLPKDSRLTYAPTSVMFLKIPSISRFEWHPFSIISSSTAHENTMSVLVKCEGQWTSCLYSMIQAELQSNTDTKSCIPVAVEGPYGPPTLEMLRHDSLILIAGGVGITPFLSILQEIASASSNKRLRHPTRVQLIHVVKRSEDVCLLNPILPILKIQPEKAWSLKLKIFVTQEKQIGIKLPELLNEVNSQVQTVTFNKSCRHYAIHGNESWSWMAAVTTISSCLFLFLLVCFNHAFVPNLKKTSKQKSSSMIPDLVIISSFFMAIICCCLFTVVLRWRKLKQLSSLSHKQAKMVDLMLSSSLDEHELHFGARPNFEAVLTEVLSEFTHGTPDLSVGVLVCGPQTMKESVARFCRMNCTAFNLGSKTKPPSFNFHSLNFTL